MRITNWSVRFHRNMQPAKYEEAGAMVEFGGTVDEAENPAQVTASALALAKRQVLVAVGKVSPATPDVATMETSETEPVPVKAAKKPRGRPKTAKAKQEEAAIAAADEAEDIAIEAADEAADLIPEDPKPSEVTDAQLQDAANAAARKHTGKVVKTMMVSTFKVDMLRDIPAADRPKFMAALKALDKA